MLHLFTFDPGWVRPRRAPATEMIFYDGHCGLCHRAVRFVLAEDSTGRTFRFAPLDSEAFRTAIPEASRARLPDSLIVLAADGTTLTRSSAVRHVMTRLGGLWRVAALLAGAVPVRLLDRAYDGIASIRGRLFAAPPQACPVVPKHLRERFAA
jgi:predicted DCC family thiol-disulfide oxidoreductase YuxK